MGTLVSDLQTKSPNYPSLDTTRPDMVARYLSSRNFIAPSETVRGVESLGNAPRNTILRVVTTERSFVVKQFRAWADSSRPAPGPDDRYRAESQFHRAARIADCAKSVLPEVLHQDVQAMCILFEDAGAARPLAGREIAPDVVSRLGWFLVSLHHHSRSVPLCAHYRNEGVVGWQMTRLFARGAAGDRKSAGGAWLARWRERNSAVAYALEDALGAMERGGSSLVHGDFSPANWVQNGHGPRVVDGEFSFFGPPEYDAGSFIAGLLLERQSSESVRAALDVIERGCFRYDLRLVAAFAGVHVCEGLENPGQGGENRPRGSTAVALLRRLQQAIETRSLSGLVRP